MGIMEHMMRVSRVIVTLILVLTLAPACNRQAGRPQPDTVVSFNQVDLEELPAEPKKWAEERHRRRGTYVRDFGDKTYLLVSWGEKPTGGYGVKIEEVAGTRTGSLVGVRLSAPKPGELVTQALTYPHAVAVAQRLNRPVKFAFLGGLNLQDQPAAAKPGPREQNGHEQEEPVASSENFRVTSPRPGSTIGSPLRVTGRARVFEGSFILELEDGHNVLAREIVQATEGAPGWGAFDVTLTFPPATNPAGALLFVTEDPRDGRRREELIIPVRFR